MNEIVEFISGFNIQTILSLIAVMWYFTRHFDAKIDAVEIKMDRQAARTDKLYEMFIDLLKEGRSK